MLRIKRAIDPFTRRSSSRHCHCCSSLLGDTASIGRSRRRQQKQQQQEQTPQNQLRPQFVTTGLIPSSSYHCGVVPLSNRNHALYYRRIAISNHYKRSFHHTARTSSSGGGSGNVQTPLEATDHPTPSSSSNQDGIDTDASPKAAVSLTENLDLINEIPLADVRNFCIVAHVDHGKSSLASRILELTGNLRPTTTTNITNNNNNHPTTTQQQQQQQQQGKEQIFALDTLTVERERGITVKSTSASMLYPHPSSTNPHGLLLLNMVDTPGHADFGTEVTRTLRSVSGAVLLFDAVRGVQAQSLSVHDKARWIMGDVGVVIPALTKCDLENSREVDVALTVAELFGFDPDGIVPTSARMNVGVRELLDTVCKDVPCPVLMDDDDDVTLRAKVVDSWFEPSRGVVSLVQVLSGVLTESSRVAVLEPDSTAGTSSNTSKAYAKDHYSIQDVGILLPHRVRTGRLQRGQMGYVVVGLRDPRQARSGTFMVRHDQLSRVAAMRLPSGLSSSSSSSSSSSLSSFDKATTDSGSVLYASVHPVQADGFDALSDAVDRLALNDTGLEVQRTGGMGSTSSSNDGGPFLGPGLKVGFQGLLHVEVFRQRLADEFQIDAIVTPPKVPYKITYFRNKGESNDVNVPPPETIEDLSKWPPRGKRFTVEEPVVDVRIMAPMEYAGNIMDLIKRKRGTDMETKPIDEITWLFTAQIPWGEVVTDFHDELKTITAGYASFDSIESTPPYRPGNLSKVDIHLNSEPVPPLSFVCHSDSAQRLGRIVCQKLQNVLPRQQFVTVIQAKVESRILASERIQAYRKDVLTTGGSKSVGGGDVTRKKKLLEKQKRGKKRQQTSGKVRLSQEAFNSIVTRSSS